ncbi:DUF5337 family protein [Halovulum sp. GXIMD14793]
MAQRKTDPDRAQVKQLAIVVIAAMVIWMAGSFLGGKLGLHPSYAILLDLLVLAAFLWAIIVGIRLWRRQP